MHTYDTVFDAIKGLSERGFTYNFNDAEGGIECSLQDLKSSPEHFKIIEVHRFEGKSDSVDEAVVYAIESVDGPKGVLVITAEMVKTL